MPTKGYRTTAERNAAAAVACFPQATTWCPKCGTVSINTTCPKCVVPTEAMPERPNQMSFGEQVVEAIGEHIDARISYAHSRLSSGAEWANADEVEKTGARLQTLLDKVRFAL